MSSIYIARGTAGSSSVGATLTIPNVVVANSKSTLVVSVGANDGTGSFPEPVVVFWGPYQVQQSLDGQGTSLSPNAILFFLPNAIPGTHDVVVTWSTPVPTKRLAAAAELTFSTSQVLDTVGGFNFTNSSPQAAADGFPLGPAETSIGSACYAGTLSLITGIDRATIGQSVEVSGLSLVQPYRYIVETTPQSEDYTIHLSSSVIWAAGIYVFFPLHLTGTTTYDLQGLNREDIRDAEESMDPDLRFKAVYRQRRRGTE